MADYEVHREIEGSDDALTRRRLLAGSAAAGAMLALGRPLDALAATEAKPKRGGRLRLGMDSGSAAETLYLPGATPWLVDFARSYNLYDSLVRRGPDWSVRLQLAKSVRPNKDGSVWHVELRRGVEFHNGKTLTADDVLYTLRYVLSNKKFAFGKNLLASLDAGKTRKRGPYALDIAFKEKRGVFPAAELESIPILPAGFRNIDRPVGTGPFKYKSFTRGNRSVFVRNPSYWVHGRPYLDELEIISFTDKTAKLNAFLAGQTHGSDGLAPAQARAHRNNRRVKLLQARGGGGNVFTMRTDVKPFNDVRVRTAMKLALDRKAVVDRVYLGFADVGNDVFGPSSPFYAGGKLPRHSYNPSRARQLLREAGYPNGLEFTTSTVEPNDVLLQVFKQSARAAGVTISIEVVDAAKGSTLYLQQPFGQSWWGNFAGIEEFYNLCCNADAAYNETHWVDEKWVALVEQANATLSPTKRRERLRAVQERFQRESGYIVPAFPFVMDAVSPKLNGLTPSALAGYGNFNFLNTWLA